MAGLSTWFALGAVGMALGTLALAYGYRLVPRRNWPRYSILVAVPLIAVGAYALMALDYWVIDTQTGDIVFGFRYLDWLLTTPLHVLYLGLLVGAAKDAISKSLLLMGATIVLGFLGAYFAPPLKWVFFAAGSVAFVGVIYYTFADFETAAQGSDQAPLFRKLRAFVVVLWLLYPVIWLLAPIGFGLMQVETAALVLSYLDVVAKVGFGLIALSGQLSVLNTPAASPATGD